VLSAEGHEVSFAAEGNEGLQTLSSRHFDLVILDVVMPGKNGYQLCREIKSNARLRDIPVVMMTTKGLDADKFWGFRQGADEYLVKPCSKEDLIRVVNKYLRSTRGLATNSSVGSSSPAVTSMRDFSGQTAAENQPALPDGTNPKHPAGLHTQTKRGIFSLKDNPFYKFKD
jgi:DNA-binding response OmpR family regulator